MNEAQCCGSRLYPADAAAVWRIVRDEVASKGVAGEDVWVMDDREAA